jgi:hypothetical protein
MLGMRRQPSERGIALITVLLATVLLLVLVAVLVDLGTIQLQRSSADLRALQSLAGADAGTAWARSVLASQKGDIQQMVSRLAETHGQRRFPIDDHTYVVVTVVPVPAQGPPSGDHLDVNLEQNAQVVEQPLQIQSSATVFTDDVEVAHRSTTTLVRVFPTSPFSDIVGYIDDGGPVGIDSPGDAAGQKSDRNTTELLVNACTTVGTNRNCHDQLGDQRWNDNNSQGPGPLP